MTKKNILLISFDDAVAPWPYRTAFGEPLRTPNLDRLCARATAFHGAYAQAPICGPSRASMMTGRLPPETGILSNDGFSFSRLDPQAMWVRRLRDGGYFCSSGGKVHHGYRPLPPALHRALYDDGRKRFRDDMGLPEEIRPRARSFGGFRKGWGTTDAADDGGFYDARVADSAIAFLQEHDGAPPFYREVGFFSPHVPWITPARFKTMYDAARLRPPPDWAGYVADNAHVAANIPETTELRATDWWQKSVRNYFSAYSHGDHHLGRVLDALWQSRHAHNTVVVLVSDHGFHLGNRNLLRKTTLWEQSLHVPLVVFNPDDGQGRVVRDLVALTDVGPTVLDFAGMEAEAGGNGRSLRGATLGQGLAPRAIPSFYKGAVSVRAGDFRIIRYDDGSVQLFDCRDDYWQLRDLGRDHPAFADMNRLLQAEVEAAARAAPPDPAPGDG